MTDVIRFEEEPQQPQHPITGTTPAHLLALAVQGGADIAKLEKLMELQERWEANEARKAFVAAMAAFKAEPMVIGKHKQVRFTTSKGTTEYMHAELSDVTDVVVPNLSKHGLSHDWQVRQDGKGITVICTITHVLGHSKQVEMTAPADESGGKNTIQAIASTKTYLERYTLLAATGLATGGTDNDGRGDPNDFDPRVLEEATLEELDAVADSKRKAWHDELAGIHSESIAHIKARLAAEDYTAAVQEWQKLSQEEQRGLWLAPTKGGCFTTRERELIRKAIGTTSTSAGTGND